MVEMVAAVVGLVVVTAAIRAGARRTGMPEPIALLVVGIGASFIPGLPDYRIDPELVLVVMLPVLLYCAAFAASLPAFRIHLRPILLLSVGLTIVSALAAGAVAAAIVPGLGLAAGVALGAVVAPPTPSRRPRSPAASGCRGGWWRCSRARACSTTPPH